MEILILSILAFLGTLVICSTLVMLARRPEPRCDSPPSNRRNSSSGWHHGWYHSETVTVNLKPGDTVHVETSKDGRMKLRLGDDEVHQ